MGFFITIMRLSYMTNIIMTFTYMKQREYAASCVFHINSHL